MDLMDRGFARLYPKIIKISEEKWLRDMRAELLAPVSGDVLEIGAGTGLNLPHYGRDVTSLTLTETSPHMLDRLKQEVATQRPDVSVSLASAESLPADSNSVDHVVSTLVLCSVADQEKVFSEVRRVLRPGGTFVLLEHVAGTGRLEKWQRRADPFTKFFGRGCHVTRRTRANLERAGFDTSDVKDHWSEHEPKIYAPHIVGVARPIATG